MAESEELDKTLPPCGYVKAFDDVFPLELKLIQGRWSSAQADNLTGLALSGGGIRSAAFAFGAIQQLQMAGFVKRLHYLSTVSGGGYSGAALTWFLSRKDASGQPVFGVEKGPFPFTGGEPAGSRRSDDAGLATTADADLAGRPIVDFIRQRSSYLLPGSGLDLLSAFAIVMRSVVISLFGYLLLASLFGLVILRFGVATWGVAGYPLAFVVSAGLIAALLASMIVYSMVAPAPFFRDGSYFFRHHYERLAGSVLRWVIGLAIFGLWLLIARPDDAEDFSALTPIMGRLRELSEALTNPQAAAAAGGIGALGGLLTRAMVKANRGLLVRLAMPLIPPLALLLLVFGLGMGGLLVAGRIYQSAHASWWAFALIGFLVLYSLYTNLNLTGLHRFYRDRLMETFMPRLRDVRDDIRNTRTDADSADLAEMFPPRHEGPFHLINTNLVLLDGALARYRSRSSDSFVLSPLFCGSESTGFIATREWMPGPKGDWIPRFSWLIRAMGPITLPTAMAISAAALNPRTGADGKGITRRASVSTLLTILNLRLGCWLPSPQMDRIRPRLASFYPPNFVIPGLTQGLLGFGRDENATWVELTDGGHFDNTGLYELARRRVKTIYFVDGTEDPETSFASFANAIEKIYIDFNVKVVFGETETFSDLMLDAGDAATLLAKRFRLAKNGYAVAELTYPAIPAMPAIPASPGQAARPARPARDKIMGKLYYIKATMTAGLPASLYSYKADNPAFPSEPTTDQFFTEQQFEAYRALGHALAKRLTSRVSPTQPQAPRSGGKASGGTRRTSRATPSPPISRPSG